MYWCNAINSFVLVGKGLVVSYSKGDHGQCAVRRRRSDNDQATVNIYFSCGNTIGHPEVIPKYVKF